MAFPTKTSAGIYSERWANVLRTTEQMREITGRLKAQLDTQASMPAQRVSRYSTTLQALKLQLDQLISGANVGSPSFTQFVQGQAGDSAIDITLEHARLTSAHDTLIAFFNISLPMIGLLNFAGGVEVPVFLSDEDRSAISASLSTYLAEFAS